jgi:hypothetical protein
MHADLTNRTPRRSNRTSGRIQPPLAAFEFGLAWLLVLSAFSSPAFGDAVRGIRALTTRPVVARDGVLMLPLGAERPGDRWPEEVRLRLADGSMVNGIVVWVSATPREAEGRRRWTDDAAGLAVRAIRRDDETSGEGAAAGEPYLVARMPPDGDGPIRLRRQTLEPIWLDDNRKLLGDPVPGPERPILERTVSPDRPDPESPFEYWRWVLLADRLDRRPPPSDVYGPIGSLVAEHYAGLFRIGLARLGSESPGVAITCRNLLTQTAIDGRTSFAVWVTDPGSIGQLLATLTDFRMREPEIARSALAWADSHSGMLIWPELAGTDRVEIAAVNRSASPIVARLGWRNATDPPIAVELPPGRLERLVVDRPNPDADVASGGRHEPAMAGSGVLEIRSGAQIERFAFGSARIDARPPGVFIGPLLPPVSLADVEARRGPSVDGASATFVHVRKRSGRWEVFFDCRRVGNTAENRRAIRSIGDAEDLRNVEAITLLLGSADAAGIELIVPESGPYRVVRGPAGDELEVHRASYADRWYCRIVLPRSWLVDPSSGRVDSVEMGFRRAHSATDSVETAPYTSSAWRQRPGRIIIGLDRWDTPRIAAASER